MTRSSSRRALLAGACAACAATLAGCARYGTSNGLAGAPAGAPAYGGPSNIRMTPAAIDALHGLARPEAESVAFVVGCAMRLGLKVRMSQPSVSG